MKLSVSSLTSLCLSFLAFGPAAKAQDLLQDQQTVAAIQGRVDLPAVLSVDKAELAGSAPALALSGLIGDRDKRYATFFKVMELMKERGHRVMVETGTARNGKKNCGGDGCSTVVLSKWAAANPGMTLASVDLDPNAVREAASAVTEFPQTKVVCSDSVKFLREYPEKIDFLYLDSYDFDGSNPNPSQRHHLKEIVVAYDKLHENSVVMVDDCGLVHGGKCELVEIVLKELGWKVAMKSYQLVMVLDPERSHRGFLANQLSPKSFVPASQGKSEDLLIKVLVRIGMLEKRLEERDNFIEELRQYFQ